MEYALKLSGTYFTRHLFYKTNREMIGLKKLIAIGLAMLVLCMAMPAMAQGQKNLYQAAVDNGFTKLVAGLKFAGLDKTMSGTGQYTVLAPTDAAFDKLPSGAMGSLMSNKPEMTSVLQRHVIKGRYTADQLLKMGSVTTVNGMKLHVYKGPGGSVVVGGATIVKPDIQASNGMIQGIDKVMLVP
jgi:uncharacterized surface protein with fasciclin (FAS1) repeats